MHITDASETLRFKVVINGKEEFAITRTEISTKAYIIADTATDIVLEVSAFNSARETQPPPLLIELCVDGVLRNVFKPRTGRGLADQQFAEAKIDRGLIMTMDGDPIMKRFRFIDLDLDNAILDSRLVKEAGSIQVRLIYAGAAVDTEEHLFEYPSSLKDRCAVSLLHGELNNTVGIRFDGGNESIADTKYTILQDSIERMGARQKGSLGKLLAQFKFMYGSVDMLNQLGVISKDHKLFDEQFAASRLVSQQKIRGKRYNRIERYLKEKAIFYSDYTLCATNIELSPFDRIDRMPIMQPQCNQREAVTKRKRSLASEDSLEQTSKNKRLLIPYPSTPPTTPRKSQRLIWTPMIASPLKAPCTPAKQLAIGPASLTPSNSSNPKTLDSHDSEEVETYHIFT